MATQPLAQPEHYADLTAQVSTWERRLRQVQTFTWLPRVLLPGLLVGAGVGIASRLTPLLTNRQVALLTLAAALVGLLMMLVMIWLRGRTPVDSARRFDRTFGLQERVSTALELLEGRIQADAELSRYQIDDALHTARRVDTASGLPFTFRRWEWAAVVLLAALVAALVILPNDIAAALMDDAAAEQAIDNAEAAVMDIIEEIAADPALNDQQREALLEALQANLDTLREEELTIEEAVATLNEVESLLNAEADRLENELQVQQSALESALDELRPPPPAQPQPEAEVSPSPLDELLDLLNELREQVPNMTPDQLGESAQALDGAAPSLESISPEAAQALEDAAESMRQGDTEGAQGSLEEAIEALEQQGEQQGQQGQSSQQLQEQAEQAGEAGDQVAQQGQQGQPGQQGQQGQQNQPGQPGQQGQQQDGQQGDQQGSQQGNQQGGQQGNQQGNQPGGQQGGQQGNQQGNQPGGQQGQQQGQQGGQQGQGSSQGAPNQAGNQPGQGGDTTGAPQGDLSNQQSQGEGGEGQFDEIYSPRTPGGNGGEDIRLNPNPGDQPLQQGDFRQNPDGRSTVPYNQVFREYESAANEALNRDYVPLGLQDIVRDYFTSLAPRSQSGE